MPQYHLLHCSESTHQTTYEREHHNPIYGENYDNAGPSSENGPENNIPSGDSEFVYDTSYGETHEETRVSGQDPRNTGDMYTYIATDSPEHKRVVRTDSSAAEISNPLYESVEASGDVIEGGISYGRLDRSLDVSEDPVESRPRKNKVMKDTDDEYSKTER